MIDMRDPNTWRHLPKYGNPDQPACLIANKLLAEIESGQINSATRKDLVVLVHWLVPNIAILEWLLNGTIHVLDVEELKAELRGGKRVFEMEHSVRMQNAIARQEPRRVKTANKLAELERFMKDEYAKSDPPKWPSALKCLEHFKNRQGLQISNSMIGKKMPGIKKSILESIAKAKAEGACV